MNTRTMAEAKFDKLLRSGMTAVDAAYESRQWEKKAYPNRWSACSGTHCERSEECRSPSDCCANLIELRAGNNPHSTPK